MSQTKNPPEFSTHSFRDFRQMPYFNFSKFSGSKLHISSTCAPLQPEIKKKYRFLQLTHLKRDAASKESCERKHKNIT